MGARLGEVARSSYRSIDGSKYRAPDAPIVSTAFCTKCGKPLYPGAEFCGYCAAPATAPSGEAPSRPVATPDGSLSVALGLTGVQTLVAHERTRADGGRFDLLDGENQLRVSLQGVPAHPRWAVHFGSHRDGAGLGQPSGIPGNHAWVVLDRSGVPHATILVGHSGAGGHATLIDPADRPTMSVTSEAEGWGGYRLSANRADGTELLRSAGKIHASEIELVGPSATIVATIRWKTFSFGDTYALEIATGADPMPPLIVVLLLDRIRRGSAPPSEPHGRREARL